MATHGRIGNNKGYVSPLSSISYTGTTTLNLRKPNVGKALYEDRWYASRPYAIGKGDDISIVLDNDVTSKRFDVSLSRRVSTTASTYGNTNVLIADYAGTMFGPTVSTIFPFEDFAVLMQPRVRTNPATTSEILWHWKGFGANDVAINYDLPILASQPASWKIDYTTFLTPVLSIVLSSDVAAPDTFTDLTPSSRIAVANIAELSPTTGHYFWLLTGYGITTLQSDGTDTTVTVTSPAGITLTGTGLTNGDAIYLNVDAGIPWIASGGYNVHTVSGMTFKVSAATGGAQGPTAGGTSNCRFGTSATSGFNGFSSGNTLVLDPLLGLPANVSNVGLQDTSAGLPYGLKVQAKYGNAAAVTVPVLSVPITNLARVQGFRSGGLISALVNGINADTTAPVTATAVGVGGAVWIPTWYGAANDLSFLFVDGINYVKTTSMTPSGGGYAYTLDFKLPVDPSLVGIASWASEEVYLCPMTAANVCSYLNNLAVCGLSANGKAETSSGGSKIQISTSTIGSVGSVQIRGGLANTALANVRGAAFETTDFLACNVVVPTTQTSGFHVGWPVEINNSVPYIKENDLTNRDLVSIVGNTWTVGWVGAYPLWLVGTTYAINNEVYVGATVYRSLQNANTGNDPTSGPPGWWTIITPANATVAASHAESNIYWQIERHGNYMAMVWAHDGFLPDLSLAEVGNYLVVSNDGMSDDVSVDNCGTFVITAIDIANDIVYFENASAVEEVSWASINLISMDSLMPGDQIVVGSDVWDPTNRRTFTVNTVNYVSDGDTTTFTTVETPTAISYPPVFAIGPQPTVQVRSGRLHSFVKTINSIVPLVEDTSYSIIGLKKGTDDVSVFAIGENYGSQLNALDKFAFTVATTIGTDGYAHSVGLIGEADKVMYGYETDPVSYPGVVAAGSNINISGLLVKRIQVGLNLRVRGTVSVIFEAVRGAVATFVNNSKVGESIAISDIISVASSIGGVEAVSVSSPAYTTTSDRITVQPYEKPLVLQPELDITLTLIG